MTSTPSVRRVGGRSLALAAVAAFGLGACLPTPHQQSMPLAADFITAPTQHSHEVVFALDEVALSEAEQMELTSFVLGVRPRPDDRVSLSGGGLRADQRFDVVTRALAADGVGVDDILPEPDGARAVTVTVRRETIIPVRCQPGGVPLYDTLRPVTPPGCAIDVNLARMVANPDDLTHGRTVGAADGQGSVLAIDRYRTDQAPAPLSDRRPLIAVGTGSGGGSEE